MKKSFMDSIGDEKLAEMIDATFNYEKRGGVMRVGLLRMLPAVAAILLVIGLVNFLPMISFGGDYGITPGVAIEPEPVVAEADCEQVVEADCEYILDDGDLDAINYPHYDREALEYARERHLEYLHGAPQSLVNHITVTWTWARTDENGGVTIMREHGPEWVTLAELDARIHDIDRLVETGWLELEYDLYGYVTVVVSPEGETIGAGFGTDSYESLHRNIRQFFDWQVELGNLTREEADFYIAGEPPGSAAVVIVEAVCEYIADDTDLGAFMEALHCTREMLAENIPVTWTWARTDENGGVTILRGRDHEPEWVTLAELDAIIHDIDNLAVKSIDSVTEAIEMGWPENENISFSYGVVVFSPERETVGLGIGTSCYESLLESVRLTLNSEVARGTLTREEANFYIAEVAQRAAAVAYP